MNLKSIKKKEQKEIDIHFGEKLLFIINGIKYSNAILMYELAQIASLSQKSIEIIILDDRKVNEEDLLNSKYIKKDLGLSAAKVTSDRCNASFSTTIKYMENPTVSTLILKNILKDNKNYFPVLIEDGSRDTLKENILKMAADCVCISSYKEDRLNYIDIVAKENGDFLINNIHHTSNTSTSSRSYLENLEVAKSKFLIIDDILLDKKFIVEKVIIDTESKRVTTRKIGGCDTTNNKENCITAKKILCKKDVLVLLVGVGGTGATVAYELSHIAHNHKKNIHTIFIDGDDVESKNLNRQKFVVSDLNRNKAIVTAKRCKEEYHINCSSSKNYIESFSDIDDICDKYTNYTKVFLGCSDSLKLRYLICQYIRNIKDKEDSVYYIDAGNDENTGQIICTILENGNYITNDFFTEFPEDLENIDKAKLVTQLSCDELMNSAPQTKGANLSAAVGIINYLHNILDESFSGNYLTQFDVRTKKTTSKKTLFK